MCELLFFTINIPFHNHRLYFLSNENSPPFSANSYFFSINIPFHIHRLYFLSNEELTALLCERDPSALEQHLRKCFDGVFSLHLDLENNVEAVGSKEGEVVPLANKLATTHASSSIENWLLQVRREGWKVGR